MPGFGNFTWGTGAPFGSWWWSKYVLYDLIPLIYRDKDSANGSFLKKFTEALRPGFDQLRTKIDHLEDLRDPLKVPMQSSESREFVLGKRVLRTSPIEQQGVDGGVYITGEFSASSARFSNHDRGKQLYLRRAGVPTNNGIFTIVTVISNTTVQVTPKTSVDTQSIRWDLREVYADPPNQVTVEVRTGASELGVVHPGWTLVDGVGSFPVITRQTFPQPLDEKVLLTERQGTDGQIDSEGRLRSATYQFQQSDVGKVVFLSKSTYPSSNGRFEILAVDRVGPSDTRAVLSRLDAPGTLPAGLFDGTGTVRYRNLSGYRFTVEHVLAGINTAFASTLDTSGTRITITLATNAYGQCSTLASQVVAAVLALTPHISVTTPGGGTGLAGPLAISNVPGEGLPADSGLFWAQLRHGHITLQGSVPIGVVATDGTDGSLQPTSTTSTVFKTMTSAPFRVEDIGRLIVIRGSTVGNDGVFAIQDVPIWGSGAVVILSGRFTLESSGLGWELRDASLLPNPLHVKVSAPSQIQYLAQDFGLEVDSQQSEQHQRSWLKYANRWIDEKGSAKGYEIVAALSGYTGSAAQLFNLSWEQAQAIPASRLYEIGELHGVDGALLDAVGASVTFTTSAYQGFRAAQIGRYLHIRGSADAINSRIYEVVTVVNASTLTLKALGGSPIPSETPDARNGALQWDIVRLYTDLQPLRARYDDFAPDVLSELLGYTVDSLCWDTPIVIGAAAGFGSLIIENLLRQSDFSYLWISGHISVVQNLGVWKLADVAGISTYLESVPELVPSGVSGVGNSRITWVGFDPANTNTLTVILVDPGAPSQQPSISVTTVLTSTTIKVSLATNGFSVITSTAAQVVALVRADLQAAPILSASVYPGNGSGVVTATSVTLSTAAGLRRTSVATPDTLTFGEALLNYVCQIIPGCDFCPSYRMLLTLTMEPAVFATFSDTELEHIYERTLLRMNSVKPAHVELIVRSEHLMTASLNLTASIDDVEHNLFAFLSPVFDAIPLDEALYPVDSGLRATLTY